MNLGTFALPLAAEFGDDYTDSEVQEVYSLWVNDAIHEIWTEYSWWFTREEYSISLTAGVQAYEMESNVTDVWSARLASSNTPLNHTRYEQMLDASRDLDSTGTPRAFWFHSATDTNLYQVIYLWPVPSATDTLLLYRTKAAPSVSSTTDLLPLPDDFLPALRERVRARRTENENNLDLSDRQYARFTLELGKLRARYTNRAADRFVARHSDIGGQHSDWPWFQRPDYIVE